MAEMTRRRGKVGYLLIIPAGVWLLLFFVIPFYSLIATSLYDQGGSDFRGWEMTYAFSNYTDAIQEYWQPLVRALGYAAAATLICLVLGYVLAYAIAFKSGRWKTLLLVLVIAPFFTSFLLRTLSWQLILADDWFVADVLRFLQLLGDDGRLLNTPFAVITRPRLQLPAVHGAAAVCLDRQDRPAADGGVRLTCTATRSSGSSRSPGRCRCRAWCPARC